MKKNRTKITENNFFIKLYNLKEKHWIKAVLVTSIFGIIPFVFSSIKVFIGNVSDNILEVISISGFIFYIVFFIGTIFLQISDGMNKRYKELIGEKSELDLNFNLKLIQNVNEVCNKKYNTLVECLETVKKGDMEIPTIINKPCVQLKYISNAISNTINFSLNGDGANDRGKNDVRTNIVFRLTKESNVDWQIADNEDFDYDGIESIVNDKDSLFNHALSSQRRTTIRNSKKEIYKDHCYIPCDVEDVNDLKGSILYYKMPLRDKKGRIIVDCIIMVYTCEKQFTKYDDDMSIENVRYNIETVLMKFEYRIKIELCLYYLHFLKQLEQKE